MRTPSPEVIDGQVYTVAKMKTILIPEASGLAGIKQTLVGIDQPSQSYEASPSTYSWPAAGGKANGM